MDEVYTHPQFEDRRKRQLASLRALERAAGVDAMIRYAAESYAYWSCRALVAEKNFIEACFDEGPPAKRRGQNKNKENTDVHQPKDSD